MSEEGTTDATARAADPHGATDPGVGVETVPPVTKLESSEEVPAEKRARRPEEATGSGKTIVQPPEEVKARLAERQRKQRERAEAARAEAARRQAEEQAAAKDAASRERSDEKKAPAESSKAPADAVSEKDRRLARQKELAARREHRDMHAPKGSPQTSALDANARFLAAAAARAAARVANGEAALSPTFASSAVVSASAADTPPAFTGPPRQPRPSVGPSVRSFEEVMAEKKKREADVTDEARAAAAAAEAALVTKTIAVRTEDDQTVEITMKVHGPRERLAQLEARRAAKEAAKREREAKEERARRDRAAMKAEETKAEEMEEERRDPAEVAKVAAETADPVPPDSEEETPVPAERAVADTPEKPEREEKPEPARKRARAKTSDATTAAAAAAPKRARRSTRK